MKILILQLARLGDIYLTWPTVQALRKKYPEANIHFLCRSYYQSATVGMPQVDKIWSMPTASLIEPLLKSADCESVGTDTGVKESLEGLEKWVEKLKAESFDLIVNLSFSPFSSYLTHFLARKNTEVRGYTRTSDGYLALPDDASAYFYAQVGVGKSNRFHLADIFGEIAGVALSPKDWVSPLALIQQSPYYQKSVSKGSSIRICMHVGASANYKCLRPETWSQLIKFLSEEVENRNQMIELFLVGTQAEGIKIEVPKFENANLRVHNVCGKTQLIDMFALVQCSDLVVGCDSVAIHMASLAEIPCFNFSFSTVNFHETGPLVEGSRILYSEFPEMLNPRRAAKEIALMLVGAPSYGPLVTRLGTKYVGVQSSMEWELIRALYLGEIFPRVENSKILTLLVDTFQFGLEQLKAIEAMAPPQPGSLNSRQKSTLEVFDQVGGLVKALESQAPQVTPLLSWFQTELVRIPQGDFRSVLTATKKYLFEISCDCCVLERD